MTHTEHAKHLKEYAIRKASELTEEQRQLAIQMASDGECNGWIAKTVIPEESLGAMIIAEVVGHTD